MPDTGFNEEAPCLYIESDEYGLYRFEPRYRIAGPDYVCMCEIMEDGSADSWNDYEVDFNDLTPVGAFLLLRSLWGDLRQGDRAIAEEIGLRTTYEFP